MKSIYILKLENNKWYIGKTANIHERIQQHLNGCGAEWTKLYKPIRPLQYKVKELTSLCDEDYITEQYMLKYGIPNVRGGSYNIINLPDYLEQTLERKIRTFKDLCYQCGENHYVKQCKSYSNINGTSGKNKAEIHGKSSNDIEQKMYENSSMDKLTIDVNPEKHGTPWTDIEEKKLRESVNGRKITCELIMNIATEHKRTHGSIRSKLNHLHLITKEESMELSTTLATMDRRDKII